MKKILSIFHNFFTKGDHRTISVKKNIVGSAFLKGVSILISFLLVPMTIGYVSDELYGVWLTLSSIMTWFGFFDIGFSQGLKNKLTEALAINDWEKGKSLVSSTYFFIIIVFVPLCVILTLLVPHIDWTKLLNTNPIYEADIQKALNALVVFFCLKMIINVIVSVVAAFQKVALSSSFEVIGQFLAFIMIFIMTKTTPPSLINLCFAFSAMPILVAFVASIILYSKQFSKISPSIKFVKKENIKDIFNLGYKFFLINIQVVVLYQSTNVLISNVSSPLQVTSYNIAYKYLNIAMMAYTIITSPLWPAYTDAYVKNDYTWMKNMRNRMLRILALSVAACAFLVLISKPVYYVWIGDKADIPFVMTVLVGLYVCCYCWMNLNGTLLVGMGKIQVETIITVFGMLVHIPFSLFLSRYIGPYGVIISMIIINMTYAIIMNIQVNKLLNKTAEGIWLK